MKRNIEKKRHVIVSRDDDRHVPILIIGVACL